MPAERIGMRDAREVIRLKSASVSTHEIARRLGLARSTVRETLKRAETAGLACPLPDDMTDAALEAALYASRRSKRGHRRDRRAGLGRRASRTAAQARHPADPVGRIHRGQPGRLQLLALCCGPGYVSFLRGSLCDQDGRARLTQHKSGPRLANLTRAGVCHGSATFFRQRRRLPCSRRAIRRRAEPLSPPL